MKLRISIAAAAVLGLCILGLRYLFPGSVNGLPVSDWRVFRSAFVEGSGRVVDTGNGGISHSEGQGYGMLIAHAYGDRRTFEKMWSWTRAKLQTRPGDKLLSWKWTPADGGRVADANNASDGDLLVAWALVRAWRSWGEFRYSQAALEILADLRRLNVVELRGVPELLPGTEGFRKEDGTVLNPSYYIFRALDEIDEAFPGAGWKALAASGEKLIAEAVFGRWRLSPDWVLRRADGSLALPNGFPPDFGYNAVRVPLYVAWRNPSSELLKTFAAFWAQLPDDRPIPATVNLETNEFGPHPALPGMQAIAVFTRACAEGRTLAVADIPRVERSEDYYSATLKLLVKIAIAEAMGAGRNS